MAYAPAAGTGVSSALAELRAAALAAGEATDRTTYLEDTARQLARMVGADHCSILLLREGRLYHGGSVGLTQEFIDGIDGTQIGRSVGTCGAAAARGETVVTAEIATDPDWADFSDLAESAGLRACWSVPLMVSGGPVLGTFATYSSEPHEPSADELEAAAAHAALVALGLDRLRREKRLSESYEAVVVALSAVLDLRDEYTGAHSSATAALSVRVGSRLGLGEAELQELEQVAALHDIGKLGIPVEVLRAARPLTDDEWQIIRQHPVLGERILAGVPYLERVAKAVRHEHERWDGTGYPDGLRADSIPLASRIVLACDSWHAMTSDRPYRPALEFDVALGELQEGAGSQFDPEVVTTLTAVLRD